MKVCNCCGRELTRSNTHLIGVGELIRLLEYRNCECGTTVVFEAARVYAKPRNRLEILCGIHGVQGGTIFQFNRLYGMNLLSLADSEFEDLCQGLELVKKETLRQRLIQVQ